MDTSIVFQSIWQKDSDPKHIEFKIPKIVGKSEFLLFKHLFFQ